MISHARLQNGDVDADSTVEGGPGVGEKHPGEHGCG